MSWKKKILLGVIILSILSLFVDLEPKDTHISIEHPSEVETIEKKPAQTENPAESITTEKPVTDEESQTNDEYYLLTVDGGDISGNRQPNPKQLFRPENAKTRQTLLLSLVLPMVLLPNDWDEALHCEKTGNYSKSHGCSMSCYANLLRIHSY